jgi:hypothetical protein
MPRDVWIRGIHAGQNHNAQKRDHPEIGDIPGPFGFLLQDMKAQGESQKELRPWKEV